MYGLTAIQVLCSLCSFTARHVHLLLQIQFGYIHYQKPSTQSLEMQKIHGINTNAENTSIHYLSTVDSHYKCTKDVHTFITKKYIQSIQMQKINPVNTNAENASIHYQSTVITNAPNMCIYSSSHKSLQNTKVPAI